MYGGVEEWKELGGDGKGVVIDAGTVWLGCEDSNSAVGFCWGIELVAGTGAGTLLSVFISKNHDRDGVGRVTFDVD